MGIIYLLTSPSNKHYIGQTIKTLDKRNKEHVEDAMNPKKDHCKVLNNAIRKYGMEAFKSEVLLICNDDMMDLYEEKMIFAYNSLIPNGYNIKPGGSSGKHNEETKKKISLSLKGRIVSRQTKEKMISSKGKTFPMYLIKMSDGNYRVCHPNGPEKRFLSKSKTSEQKLEDALSYLNYLENLEVPIKSKKKTLPKNIQKYGEGFCVKGKGIKTRYFVSKSLSTEEKFQKAKDYLDRHKSAVQRLNGDGS